MKKYIPLVIIVIGLAITGYGGFKLIDTSMKTEQTLKEAKKAAEQPPAIAGTKKNANQAEKNHRLSRKPVKRAAYWKSQKSMRSFQSWKEPMPMT